MSSSSYRVRTVGEPDTLGYRIYLENEKREVLSYLHDVPLFANEKEGYVNMILEIPKFTNAKLEIATGEHMNPIKQDTKAGVLRYVKNLFPHHGYPWNYGALVQTWEDPTQICPHTDKKGDGDPIDVVEIGETIGFPGQIKAVKVLGIIALLDEGETDWKVIAIDINDPLAQVMDNIDDVEIQCPGLLNVTRHWFKVYKVPDGKPENHFAFNGEFRDKKFAKEIILKTTLSWRDLIGGRIPPKGTGYKVSCASRTIDSSPTKMETSDIKEKGVSISMADKTKECLPGEITRSYYGIFPGKFKD